MKTKGNYYWVLLIIPVIFIGWYFFNKSEQKELTLKIQKIIEKGNDSKI